MRAARKHFLNIDKDVDKRINNYDGTTKDGKSMLYLINYFVIDFCLIRFTRVIKSLVDLGQSSKDNFSFRSVPQTLASPCTLPIFKPTGSDGEQAVELLLLSIRFEKILELKRSARVSGGSATLFLEGKLQQAGSCVGVPVLRGFRRLFLINNFENNVSKVAGFRHLTRPRFPRTVKRQRQFYHDG